MPGAWPLERKPTRAGVAAGVLLALLACGAGAVPPPTQKRTFAFRVQSRDFQPTFRRSLLRNATVPLHGAVKDYGYFYATLYLGTPAKKFAVIVDTGSTMTYVPCSTCGSGCGPNHQDAAFDPEASSTAALISCSSPKCNCGSPRCGCATQQCTYQRSYAEQSSSSGILLEDVLALHDGLPGAPIIFGCETRETGEIYKQRADGLFGLGNSDASVVNQLVKAGVIDDVFSLCFGMVEGDGALLLGNAEVPGSVALQYTPLLTSPSHPFYYNVKLLSLAVDGQLLPVSQSLFDQGYGTVLDSGTTFTYMPTPVFKAFAGAVESYAVSHGLKRVPGPDPQYEDICFGLAPSHEELEALSEVFPSMEVQFDQGTSLVLGPLNYLFVHTFNSGKYCLGVFDNGPAGTLLGGITFRNVLVQYDRANKRVGFGPAPCKELGEMQRPPCSFFATEGSGEITAAAAAADGDCSQELLRQQQQETFELEDDVLEQQQQAAATTQRETGKQQEADAGKGRADSQWRRPAGEQGGGDGQQAAEAGGATPAGRQTPHTQQQQQEEQQGGEAGQAAGESQQEEQQQQQQQQQQEEQAQAQGSGEVVAPGIRSSGSGSAKDSGSHGTLVSVAIGMAVAVASVMSLGLAVVLLQPAARDRIRGVFGRSGRTYRSLQEAEADPEGGFTVSAGPSGNGVSPAPDVGNGGLSVELSGGSRGELQRGMATPRGITTPTKLQRTTSNTGAAGAEEILPTVAGFASTPRSSSPNRNAL